jgi:hypothetical protein
MPFSSPPSNLFYVETADRSLEDIDRLFHENGDIFIFRDKNVISDKRSLAYVEREQIDRGMDPDGSTLSIVESKGKHDEGMKV